VSFRPKSAAILRSREYSWSEHAPHPSLVRSVSSYWTLLTGRGTHVVRTLPDGCIDVTLHLARPARAYLAGAQRSARSWKLEGCVHLVGARLFPGGAALLGVDARALSDEWTPLERFLPKRAVASLLGRIQRAGTMPARIAIFDAFFSERLLNRTLDPRLSTALHQVFALQGDISIAALAKRSGTHARTLGRLFERWVGLSPKRFVRVVRLQAALRALGRAGNWARVAADLGYHDQPHFIHDVRELFGTTPGQLVAFEDRTR
jgi:AraC-like DNA-binding protein